MGNRLSHSKRESTTRTLQRRELGKPLGVVVRAVNCPASPREFPLLEGKCTIGAGRGADLLIDDDTVSRRHLELSLVPEGVAVRDLGSHNGSFYLGQRIHSAVLTIGSTIQLGQAELRIEPHRQSLERQEPGPDPRYGALVGVSPEIRKLFALLTRLESSLVNVLVEGESGTGKELIARAIHDHSLVSAGPFVAVNCGAMDRSLARSELFGHKRGAFTGALEPREGAFEAASGGTLFLDEIGELPLDVQPMLLRTLETGTITRVGETHERPVKVRVVSATHRALMEEVRAGRFREDLYYRLVVVPLVVPALRERREDIAFLAQHFAAESGIGPLAPELIHELQARKWPGNARELRNVVQAYGVLGAVPDPQQPHDAELDDALRRMIDVDFPYAFQKEGIGNSKSLGQST